MNAHQGWPDNGWGLSARPARGNEAPGQWPRFPVGSNPIAVEAARQAGTAALRDRVTELARRGWHLHTGSPEMASLSAPSYRLHPMLTVLLILVTFGAWIIPAAWLQGSKRRDTRTLTLGPDWRLIETYTRGW